MDISVSEHDIKLTQEGRKLISKGLLKQALFIMGIDISRPVTSFECYHRSMLGDVVYSERYTGYEREDHGWVKGVGVSKAMLRRVIHGNDLELEKDIAALSYIPCFTQMFIDYLGSIYGNPDKEEDEYA